MQTTDFSPNTSSLLNPSLDLSTFSPLLKGKVAIITGAVSGIGLAITQLFIAQGGLVIGGDIKEKEGKELEEKYPHYFKFQKCDVTNEEDLISIIKIAKEHFGKIDILVNNAGATGSQQTFRTITGDEFDQTMALLVKAPLLAIRHVIPYMEEQGGCIINMASIAGQQVTTAPAMYSAAKAQLIHITTLAAAELGSSNIRVNALCPGFIVTDIYNDTLRSAGISNNALPKVKKVMEEFSAHTQPIRKAGTPEDIAKACLFLASDLSSFITGQSLLVDGGYTLGRKEAWDLQAKKAYTQAIVAEASKL